MIRVMLLTMQALVAVTSIAGGLVMAVGSWPGVEKSALPPGLELPVEYLDGSPFSTYLVPGLLLAVIVGGSHTLAFLLLIRQRGLVSLAAATAGYSILVWIFVQMALIPFSTLQAVYFGAGLGEVGLLLLLLGVASRKQAAGIPGTEGPLGPVGGWKAAVGSPHDRQKHSS
ncbi:hypothetical protein J2790_001803 [Paenarthrobacter nicotinovorans]|uniref:hypothetical protein n=1 Tax=Micrococcaceae TaxID=1268 RepID=UPI0008774E47|nr:MULTISPECIES: hypothetical protein [Micrococcaceae]MDR6436682.1 hypothetical protein [Paenarthrobacter nicotinovorans]SCZ56922.1 hypothetical protein SAMN02799638_02010 [Arthrobacter sp. UNCCL28]